MTIWIDENVAKELGIQTDGRLVNTLPNGRRIYEVPYEEYLQKLRWLALKRGGCIMIEDLLEVLRSRRMAILDMESQKVVMPGLETDCKVLIGFLAGVAYSQGVLPDRYRLLVFYYSDIGLRLAEAWMYDPDRDGGRQEEVEQTEGASGVRHQEAGSHLEGN